MPGFLRRFTNVPPLEVITSIEGVIVTDENPPGGLTASGTGTVFLGAEFEDGPFAADSDADGGGIFEVFGTEDFLSRYGGFGYEYSDGPYQNPCARSHLGETWNGNGFIKMVGLQVPRLLIGRVDTSVGEVSFSAQACVESTSANPFTLLNGQTMDVSIDAAAAVTSDPVSAVSANVTGTGSPTLTFASAPGATLTIALSSYSRDVVFSAADTTITTVVSRINSAMGATVAENSGGQLKLTDPVLGTDSSVTLTNKSGSPGTILGHIAAGATPATITGSSGTFPTSGVGTFDIASTNVAATTVSFAGGASAADVAALINAALGFTAASVVGGEIVVVDNEVGELSSLAISNSTGAGAAEVGFVDPFQTRGTDPLGRTTTGAIVNATGATFPIVTGGDFTVATEVITTPVSVAYVAGDDAKTVAAKINAAVGFTMAAVKGDGQLRLSNNTVGKASTITLANGAGAGIAGVGLSAGSTTGTGNVGNVSAVTAAEVAAILEGTSAFASAGAASVSADGFLRLCSDTVAAGSIQVVAGPMQAALSLPTDLVAAGSHGGGTIPAGTRVRVGTSSSAPVWVVMQSIDVEDGEAGPFNVRVRPGLDDGTAVGTLAATINNVVDQPDFCSFSVTNASALSAALTEAQIDARYQAVLEKSLDKKQPTREANYLLLGRRSDTLTTLGRTNALGAAGKGLFGRIFITGSALGDSPTDSIADVANYRSDSVFYTALGMKVYVPEIATVGSDGGTGFTDSGYITVRPDGPLTTLCARLPPEENPGRETTFLSQFVSVETFGNNVTIDTYKAFKAAGIAAPILEDTGNMGFQSGVTSSLENGRKTMSRRRFANFVQDTCGILATPYVKRLNRQSERDALYGELNTFLSNLRSESVPALQRLESYSIDDGANAGNTADTRAAGIHYVLIKVRTLATMDYIVIRTQIGENVTITAEAA